ncbi:MAG: peptidoglycan DD-metalloendopeptidase family protein [Chloroflexi bacterium]|nr:peptidoglycan DD-metalloendopeptidase family protein [Chloroflexota bacterium]
MQTRPNLATYSRGMILLLALALSIAAFFLILSTSSSESDDIAEQPTKPPTATNTNTPGPTHTPLPSPTRFRTPTQTLIPTADPVLVATSVAQPLDAALVGSAGVTRGEVPFTVNRETQRTGVIQYEVKRGDNIYTLAERFGISIETIIWSNRQFYLNALQPGMVLNIMPVEGAIHRVETPLTVRELAEQYQVDPYTIIDTDYNALQDLVPDNMLPVGLDVVIPGGTGSKEPIFWEPPGGARTEPSGDFGATGVYGGTAVFGEGQAGSCGEQTIYGGTMPETRPAYGYLLTRDFTWEHRGVDLAGQLGDPIYAVGGGTVIFAGWSDWGYGWTVVIAHGPVMTLYAHLTGDFVWCGQQVTPGQHIGNMGSSGNSTGPHLHFEVRNSAGIPQNPHDYLGF